MQGIDILIILIGLVAFGPEKAMYAIISVYISVQIIDTLLEGLNFSKAAMIISDKNEEISQEIMKQLDRGVTGLKGVGKYTGLDKEVLLCVMSKREILTVKKIVKQVDVNAFMIVTDAREVFGEGFIEHPEMNKLKKLSKNN